jgi:cytoskeletal protein CcmA (bactofilin family)
MSSSKKEAPEDPGSEVVLGPRDILVGMLSIEGNLRVQGLAQGELRANGDIRIDDSASVTASLDGRNVSVRGRVTGNVTARERFLLAGSGVVGGDVKTARLVVEGRATLNGNVSMRAGAEVIQTDAPQSHHPESGQQDSGSDIGQLGKRMRKTTAE